MRNLVVFLLGLSIVLTVPCTMAAPMGMGYGGGYYGGMRSNTQFYYRPVMPVAPTVTRSNNVATPNVPISCLGTGSYAVIGNNVVPCKSAAAKRIKVTNKSSIKTTTDKDNSKDKDKDKDD